jgi:predicted amidohydrolase
MIEKPFKMAAASFVGVPGDKEGNLEKIAEICAELRKEKVSLVLFPELSISGFLPNHPVIEHEPWLRKGIKTVREWAETIPGPSTDRLIEIAMANDLLISAGLFENNGTHIHNTQVLVGIGVGVEGMVSVSRKLHIPMFEAPFYDGGPAPEVADTDLGRIGTCICFDNVLPESTRLLAVQGADIVLFPYASDPDPKTAPGWVGHNAMLIQTRCKENGFFGLAVNQTGRVESLGAQQTFPGGGMFIAPTGKILKVWEGETAQPGRMIVEVDPKYLNDARSDPEFGMRFRRPGLYWPLTEG